MTIPEVQAAAATLAASFTAAVREFERSTGTIVHSLPVRPATTAQQASVEVKVQLQSN